MKLDVLKYNFEETRPMIAHVLQNDNVLVNEFEFVFCVQTELARYQQDSVTLVKRFLSTLSDANRTYLHKFSQTKKTKRCFPYRLISSLKSKELTDAYQKIIKLKQLSKKKIKILMRTYNIKKEEDLSKEASLYFKRIRLYFNYTTVSAVELEINDKKLFNLFFSNVYVKTVIEYKESPRTKSFIDSLINNKVKSNTQTMMKSFLSNDDTFINHEIELLKAYKLQNNKEKSMYNFLLEYNDGERNGLSHCLMQNKSKKKTKSSSRSVKNEEKKRKRTGQHGRIELIDVEEYEADIRDNKFFRIKSYHTGNITQESTKGILDERTVFFNLSFLASLFILFFLFGLLLYKFFVVPRRRKRENENEQNLDLSNN